VIQFPKFLYDPVDIAVFYERARAVEGSIPLGASELAHVECGEQALEALPRLVHQFSGCNAAKVVVFQDTNEMSRDGESLKPLVARMLREANIKTSICSFKFDDTGQLKTTPKNIEIAQQMIEPGVAVISLGSGCITDIVKHACFEFEKATSKKVPFISIQTANSVCAFTSRMSVITMNGVKRTVPSRLPDALILDTHILRDAPPNFRTGGLGDVAVVASTFADLYLAQAMEMGSWNQTAFETSVDLRELLLGGHPAVRDAGVVGQETAAKLLTIAGLSLTVSGDSAPLSGYEHVTSHMLDMAAHAYDRPVANHGHQCALATILTLLLYQHVFEAVDADRLDVENCIPDEAAMERKVMDTFRHVDPSDDAGRECLSDYRLKLTAWSARQAVLAYFMRSWRKQKADLEKHLMEPRAFVDLLRSFGHPLRFEDLDVPISLEQVRWAFANAHLMRKRFTIGDFAFLTGVFTEVAVDRIIEQFYELTRD
jgi:glycerol-1-phosphate dehydrogenase [NAD(P)+]